MNVSTLPWQELQLIGGESLASAWLVPAAMGKWMSCAAASSDVLAGTGPDAGVQASKATIDVHATRIDRIHFFLRSDLTRSVRSRSSTRHARRECGSGGDPKE